jgi:uncharacterized protein (TIGR02246 family)
MHHISTMLYLSVILSMTITTSARLSARNYDVTNANNVTVSNPFNPRSDRSFSSKDKKKNSWPTLTSLKPQPITTQEVRQLFDRWNNALATRNPETVASLYSSQPVLLPTLSNIPRTNNTMIKDYFDHFLLKLPQGVIESGNILIGNNWAQDAGIYVFTFGVDNSTVRARYSYVYIWEQNQWKISLHHSSLMPANDG